MRGNRAGIGAAAVLAGVSILAAAAAGSGAGWSPSGNIVCTEELKATVTNGIIRYCGPATARLSVFPGVVYRNGSCTWTTTNGLARLTLAVGSRTANLRTNGRRAYLNLQAFGPPPRPSSGGLLAYAKGKRWTGVSLSFRITTRGGTFVVRGTNGSRGTAHGSFHC